MDTKEEVQTQQVGCCTPLDISEEAVWKQQVEQELAAEIMEAPYSCCTPLDAEGKTALQQPDKREPEPVYSGWVTAEMKYGMYLPAIEGILRESSGVVQYPLPGPIGVTELVKEAGIEEGSRVLEVAASIGHIAILGAKIVGPNGEAAFGQLDRTLVEPAEAHIAEYGLQDSVKVVEASAENIPYPEDYFDAVVSDRAVCCLYSKIESQHKFMNEMARVTKPGGRVVLVEAVPKGTPQREGERIPECITNTIFSKEPEKVVGMFRQAGLRSISIKRIPNSQMATKEICAADGVPIGDEYMEFVILAGTKNGKHKVQEGEE